MIKPALAEGKWVLGDRHDMSSQAYQGGGRQIDRKILDNLKRTVLGDFEPDLTIYLDIDPAVGLERVRGRGELDRIEQQSLDFFYRTHQRYLELTQNNDKAVIIDAEQPLEKVTADIKQAVENFVKKQNDRDFSSATLSVAASDLFAHHPAFQPRARASRLIVQNRSGARQ